MGPYIYSRYIRIYKVSSLATSLSSELAIAIVVAVAQGFQEHADQRHVFISLSWTLPASSYHQHHCCPSIAPAPITDHGLSLSLFLIRVLWSFLYRMYPLLRVPVFGYHAAKRPNKALSLVHAWVFMIRLLHEISLVWPRRWCTNMRQ